MLLLPLDKWSVSLLMIALSFLIETLVVRHYALAIVFVTPLTIFLAEATRLGQTSPEAMLQARLSRLLTCRADFRSRVTNGHNHCHRQHHKAQRVIESPSPQCQTRCRI